MAEEQGVKEQTDAAGQSQESEQGGQQTQTEQAVPYKRFSEVNEAKNRAEAEANVLREQMKIMAANPPQNTNGAPAGQGYAPPDYLEGLEIEDDETLSGAELKKALKMVASRIDQRFAVAAASYQFQLSNPDYPQVVGRDGIMAPALTKYLQKNPLALSQIKAHPQPWSYLYTLGKAAIEAEKAEKKPPTKTEAGREPDEEKEEKPPPSRPASPAILGGRAAFSKASRFTQMSKEEFEKHIAKIKSKG